MSDSRALTANALFHRCEPSQFAFSTTVELEDIPLALGQQRALRAARFGVGIRQEGFNLFVVGEPGAGKQTFIRQVLEPRAKTQPTPSDWCYVHDFENPSRLIALQLPAGRGKAFQRDMRNLVESLLTTVRAAFASDPYLMQTRTLIDRHQEEQVEAWRKLTAGQSRDSSAVAPEKLRDSHDAVAKMRNETNRKIKALDAETALYASHYLITDAITHYSDLPAVQQHLLALQNDLAAHGGALHHETEKGPPASTRPLELPFIARYRVKLLVAHEENDGAPLIYESNPTHANLLGHIGQPTKNDDAIADIELIKSGALQHANGGYLLVDAVKLLAQPAAWDGLKRALATRQSSIERIPDATGASAPAALFPQAIPLNLKVVLLGDRILYALLSENDPDFMELFKVVVDFEEDLDRTPETTLLFARMIGTLARRENLRPFTAAAVARLVEQSSRLAEDTRKLSIHLGEISEVACEADFWASEAQHANVEREDVEQAIYEQQYRAGRVREHILEAIDRGMLLIDSDGAKIGQINGLTVLEFGNQLVGQPARITATTRLGDGKIVDIEREVELGGAVHSKGVMILSHFIAARYARSKPLSLSASLVFEQSYAQIDGDSASLAELCALLSAIAETPVNQAIAVTGSVNQLGESQPIGGVNEKIEGFFDVCAARGLTGNQGVIIPKANASHLMLRSDVVEAVGKGVFRIFAVSTVDDAVEILTGLSAGGRDGEGNFPEDSFNFRVEMQLFTLAELWQMSAEHPPGGEPRD